MRRRPPPRAGTRADRTCAALPGHARAGARAGGQARTHHHARGRRRTQAAWAVAPASQRRGRTFVLMGTLARRPPATILGPPPLGAAPPPGLKCLIAWLMKAAGGSEGPPGVLGRRALHVAEAQHAAHQQRLAGGPLHLTSPQTHKHSAHSTPPAGCWMAAKSYDDRWRTASVASSALRLLLSWCTTPSSKSSAWGGGGEQVQRSGSQAGGLGVGVDRQCWRRERHLPYAWDHAHRV